MVSLGSGDFKLLTIKALEAIKSSQIICVPTKNIDSIEESKSYQILKKALEYLNIERILKPIYTPMKLKESDWQRQSNEILEEFGEFDRVAFITLGDASIYSTIYYILDFIAIKEPFIYSNCEVVEGITSFSSASAKVKKALVLGDSNLLIRPFHQNESTQTTTVYMRPNRGDSLENLNEDIYIFENLNLENEKIHIGKINRIKSYLTLIIDFFQK